MGRYDRWWGEEEEEVEQGGRRRVDLVIARK
jgi:hypothetical protein